MKKITKIIPALAFSLTMSSCAVHTAGVNLSGDWKVTTINGTQVPETMSEPTLSFTGKRSFSGVTGVNVMNGKYKLSGNKLRFSDAPITRMMADPVSMQVEDSYIKALQDASTVSEDNGTLILKDKSGKAVMTLKKN